ncbi:MAG: cbb3-type cytochrome oxidase subunit 3 [Burkholderiales bacterium]
MDINVLRIAVTLISFAAFVAIVFWTYRPSRKQELDQVGRSILEDGGS